MGRPCSGETLQQSRQGEKVGVVQVVIRSGPSGRLGGHVQLTEIDAMWCKRILVPRHCPRLRWLAFVIAKDVKHRGMFKKHGLQRSRMARDMEREGSEIPFSKKFSKLAFQIWAEGPGCSKRPIFEEPAFLSTSEWWCQWLAGTKFVMVLGCSWVFWASRRRA